MWRTLFFLIKTGLVIAFAVFLAEQDGTVRMDWLGYRMDINVGILLGMLVIFTLALSYLLRLWSGFWSAPRRIGKRIEDSHTKRGYDALTKGLVAVAAGDGREALRQARLSEKYLDNPPLSLLLNAQAKQLNGEREEAESYFEKMLEREDVSFLGLRGLIIAALKQDDKTKAFALLEEARRKAPNAPWVLTSYADLAERLGYMIEAESALAQAIKKNIVNHGAVARRRAALLIAAAQRRAEDNPRGALAMLKKAVRIAPDYWAAKHALARHLIQKGHKRKARKALADAYSLTPNPELTKTAKALFEDRSPLERYGRLKELTKTQSDHPEVHFALADLALAAQLWGEARGHLMALYDDGIRERRLFALLAHLEEEENEDNEKAREWRIAMETATPDPHWLCTTCGAHSVQWAPICEACHTAGTYHWTKDITHKKMALLPESLLVETMGK